MDTMIVAPVQRRTRKRYSEEFRAGVIEACLQPGISIAAVALANQLNTNMLRSWVKAYREANREDIPGKSREEARIEMESSPPTTLVPVSVAAAASTPAEDIQIEIRQGKTAVKIAWPVAQAQACAGWLREVLR